MSSNTETQQYELAYKLVEEALKGENPTAKKHGRYDNPAWIESMADHVAYRTMKMDDVEEISISNARHMINRMVEEGNLLIVTDDFWKDDKVTLP